jgi:hypothetical protein
MAYIANEKLPIAGDGKIRPFASPPRAVPGEGAAFFLVSRKSEGNPYCDLEDVRLAAGGKPFPPRT